MKKRFYPFGRGERGTQQRLVLAYRTWNGLMTRHGFSVEVTQTGAQEKTVFLVGTSTVQGKRTFFVRAEFKTAFECAVRGVKMFRVTRAVNKLHRLKRAGKDVEAQREKFYRLTGAAARSR
jgi:hypothetical protein